MIQTLTAYQIGDPSAILKETCLNLRKLEHFKAKYAEIIDCLDSLLQKRYFKWLSFFNEHYNKQPLIYTETVMALTSEMYGNDLLKTQTQYEFETTLLFYLKLFELPFSIAVRDDRTAIFLLRVALIYGRYASMQIRSFKKAGEKFRKQGLVISKEDVYGFFEVLFVKYETPQLFTSNLARLTSTETDILMFVLQGNNIRKHPKLPIPLSKKESYLLMNEMPAALHFTDEIVFRYLITAKFLSRIKNTELLVRFLSECRSFRYHPSAFYDRLATWADAYNILLTDDIGEYAIDFEHCLDYFEFSISEDESFSLKGRTLGSVIRSIDEWDRGISLMQYKRLVGHSWAKSAIEDVIIPYGKEVYHFTEITNGMGLREESELMKHCVFSYISHCIEGRCHIWSVSKEENGALQKYLTIEILRNEIVQVSGVQNARPTSDDILLIKSWAEMNDLKWNDGAPREYPFADGEEGDDAPF
jgi:hypothetical protein